MIDDKLTETVKEIEADIQYFTNLGFTIIASKFQRDLDALKIVLAAFEKTAD
jgi:hypothetical protein